MGAIVFLLAAPLLSYFLLSRSVDQMKDLAEANNEALAYPLSRIMHDSFERFLLQAPELPPDKLASHPDQARLLDEVKKVLAGTDVLKVKIYGSNGVTIFSSDPSQIGEDKSRNEGFLSAIVGRTASNLSYRDQFDAFEGKISDRDVLSTYVPVQPGAGRQGTNGVFEIYTDVTAFRQQITRNVIIEAIVVVLFFATMYGLLLATVVVGSRILARKHAETLELTEGIARAEAASKAKTDFLANMSHELRTPLNAIIGFSQVMRDSVMGEIQPPVYADYARDIHDSGSHLLALINDVLDLVKAESGKLAVNQQNVDAVALAGEAVRILQEDAKAANIKLVIETEGNLQAIKADAVKLRQVLLNLLGNAIKFSPQSNKVTVKIAASEDGRQVSFVIVDHGIGIAAADIPLCLSPFGQVDSDLNRRYEGAGLGLPLSVKLVEAMGGSLEIKSAKGRGTTAYVRFPVAKAHMVTPSSNSSSASASVTLRADPQFRLAQSGG